VARFSSILRGVLSERKRRWGLACHAIALVLVLSVLLTSRPAQADARPVFTRRLSNGLRVLICPDPGGADVSVLVRYDVGARDEPGGLEGLAHLAEHLMFTGSKHIAPGALERLLTRAGARRRSRAGWYTSCGRHRPSERQATRSSTSPRRSSRGVV